jgi:hypothetical protein
LLLSVEVFRIVWMNVKKQVLREGLPEFEKE